MELAVVIHRLSELEEVIEKNLTAFYDVGMALMEIRESRLYRNTHETFEAYCRDRWDMTHRHADRLISSSKVIENLRPMGPKPSSERQTRPLTKLSAPLQQEAWRGHNENMQAM